MDFSGQGGVKPPVAGVTPMRQNGGDEAGSGLLLWADGGGEGLFDFGLRIASTWSRRCLTSGTAHRMPFTKYARTTAISISYAGKHRRLMAFGIWNLSGNCRARADLGSCSSLVSDNSFTVAHGESTFNLRPAA